MAEQQYQPIPAAFVSRVRRDFPDEAPTLLEALEREGYKAVNRNRCKSTNKVSSKPVAWNPYGHFAPDALHPSLDPFWHAGHYYVMEAASQALDFVVRALTKEAPPARALDLCAAPGGKTSVLLNVLPDDAILVSNEIHRARAQILYENAVKQGRSNHLVSSAAAEGFSALGALFDLVVVDAPCSGEGMFRKDHGARAEWSEAHVAGCALRQSDILSSISSCVKQGGILIYSTCTFAESENDAQVDGLLACGGWEVCTPDLSAFGARPTLHGMQFFPGFTPTEGLYLVALRKVDGEEVQHQRIRPAFTSVKVLPGEFPAELPGAGDWVSDGNRYWGMSEGVLELANLLRGHKLPLLKAGIAVGELKGKQLVPDHEAAMYAVIRCESGVDLDYDAALSYLRGESGRGGSSKGWLVARYEGAVLGWMKGLGDRWNNGYPKPWRLRH